MNVKRIIGIVVLIIGVIVIIFASYEMNRVAEAKEAIHKGSGMVPHNAFSGAVGGAIEHKASEYDAPLMGVLIGGIVLAVIGGCVALFCHKKKR